MSLQDELQEELRQVNTRIEQNGRDLDAVTVNRDELMMDRSEIEQQIADAEKPKLRHGDCVQLGAGGFYFINDKHSCNPAGERPFAIGATGGGQVNADKDIYKAFVLFNSFDDATAMQEDVTEFEVEDDDYDKIRCYMAGNRMRVAIDEEDGDSCAVDIKDVPLLILKLRQIHATYLRNNK